MWMIITLNLSLIIVIFAPPCLMVLLHSADKDKITRSPQIIAIDLPQELKYNQVKQQPVKVNIGKTRALN